MNITLQPRAEARHIDRLEVEIRQALGCRARKAGGDALDLLSDQRRRTVLDPRPFAIHFLAELVCTPLLHPDLDASLMDVVAAAVAVVDAQDRVAIGEQ